LIEVPREQNGKNAWFDLEMLQGIQVSMETEVTTSDMAGWWWYRCKNAALYLMLCSTTHTKANTDGVSNGAEISSDVLRNFDLITFEPEI
jgi:hypothetical protein